MSEMPGRRWFRFSLRSMFVLVTLFAIWLGWQMKVVRERRAYLKSMAAARAVEIEKHPGMSMLHTGPIISQTSPRTIPFWRRYMGDEALTELYLSYYSSDAEVVQAKRLSPEAKVTKWDDHSIPMRLDVD